MALSRIVLVTGLSGAGKSQTMKSFEDLGFSCVDNLPPILLSTYLELATSANADRVAIAPDVSGLGPFGDTVETVDRLSREGNADRGALPRCCRRSACSAI